MEAQSHSHLEETLHSLHDIQVLQQDPNSPIHSAATFEDLQLAKDLLKGIYATGFARPSKIQAHALPMLLRDPPEHLIAQAQSGTGKTAAFSLAILSRINYNDLSPQALVLAPSRELALQIVDVMRTLARFTRAVIVQVVPETERRQTPFEGQVIVGTPGRVADMIKRDIPNLGGESRDHSAERQKFIDTSKIKMLVLDEADCMLDVQGFAQQIQLVKRLLPQTLQLVFFSATWDQQVLRFATEFVQGYSNQIRLQTYELTLSTVKQFFIDCDSEEDRFRVLMALYGIMTIAQSIIFVRRRDVAEKIAQRMQGKGHHVSFLHGKLAPDDRDTVMDAFRQAKTKVLVTTNVLARGIDIDRVNMVINYDLPTLDYDKADPVTYLHRIGRTGRFGRMGVSVNFVHSPHAFQVMQDIAKYYRCEVTKVPTELVTEPGTSPADWELARLERMEGFFKKQLKG